MNNKITPFLMFEGDALKAMKYYTSIFKDSKIVSIIHHDGNEDLIHLASFSLKGQVFMCSDSNINHNFTFTPSISMYVTCDSDDEINNYFDKLSDKGKVLMPLDKYPFSEKFAWVEDKFGVSWQLSLI